MVKPVEPRMYVIVRSDLEAIYRMVQGGHALASYTMSYPKETKEWDNEYLIYLSTFLEGNLRKVYDTLVDYRMAHYDKKTGDVFKVAKFHEPDQNDQMTAIAVFENGSGHVSKLLGKLPLAKV